MRDALTTRLLGDARFARIVRVDDSGDVQRVQLEFHRGEVVPDVPHLMPYGLTARPPKESRTLAKLIGGAWDNVAALSATHGPHRPRDLDSGDVTLYDGHGHRLDLRDEDAAFNCDVDSTGYKTDGAAGMSGELKITITAPAVAGVATLTFKGGILTACVATGNCVWTPPVA